MKKIISIVAAILLLGSVATATAEEKTINKEESVLPAQQCATVEEYTVFLSSTAYSVDNND